MSASGRKLSTPQASAALNTTNSTPESMAAAGTVKTQAAAIYKKRGRSTSLLTARSASGSLIR
jgi:hypothetical protein